MKRVIDVFGVVLLFVLCSCGHIHTISVYNVLDYGAKGDGITDDAVAIQSAIEACSKAGGGRVLLPSGYTFMAGPFSLASRVDLHIAVNTVLIANPDESVYTKSAFKENRGEGMLWISGEKLRGLTISGQGEINGNGVSFMGEELEDSYELKPVHEFNPRPHLLTLIGCENIRICDLQIKNSAYWTVHLIGYNDVVIRGITLLNNLKVRNGDSIDIDHSRNVRISDCYIESGDDCICLKNRREYDEYGPCENIVVTNCTMTSRSCAIKIGSENVDRISHVTFDNCIIRDSNRGIGIQNRDEGTVSNIVFSNMIVDCKYYSDVWWGKAEPIYVTAYRRAKGDHKDAGWRFPKGAMEGEVGRVSNIFFSNIKCESENGIFVGAETPEKVKDIFFDQVDILIYKRSLYENTGYDIRPCEGEGFIRAKTSAFYLTNVSDITIRNSSVRWGDTTLPSFGKAIEKQNVKGLVVNNLQE
ncbi:MAG: glycoside hydrolase family 28 protein [Bacteroides sp.]|nr:glycoside hydrolase family 28 protein [Bacteroides sp.]